MKSSFFKYTTFTLIIINVWTLYGFFDYYIHLDCDTWVRDWGLALFFFSSVIFGISTGIIIVLLRIFLFFKNKKHDFVNSFAYIFTAVFNFNIFVIGFTAIFFKKIYIGNNITLYLLCDLLVTIIVLVDLYINKALVMEE